MTENEVINKLEFFKKAIINLKNENNDLNDLVEELSNPLEAIVEENLQNRIEELEEEVIVKENLQNKVEELEEENFKLKDEIEEYKKTISSLKNDIKKISKNIEQCNGFEERYNSLKEKAYKSIKHLVEDVIEPREKETEEINKRIAELEKLLIEKNKDHKMIVKSAEKELAEMIEGK
jgi:chromosome segregation ATPase